MIGPLLILLALVLIGAGMFVGIRAFVQHRNDGEPIVSARRAIKPIARRDEGGIRNMLDAKQSGDPKEEAKQILRFFRGWAIDVSTVKIMGSADDNGYTLGFTARRPTGTRARIHGALWPQGKTGDGPWKLTSLWVDHGTRHKARMIIG